MESISPSRRLTLGRSGDRQTAPQILWAAEAPRRMTMGRDDLGGLEVGDLIRCLTWAHLDQQASFVPGSAGVPPAGPGRSRRDAGAPRDTSRTLKVRDLTRTPVLQTRNGEIHAGSGGFWEKMGHSGTEMGYPRTEMGHFRTEIRQSRTEMGYSRTDIGYPRTEMPYYRTDVRYSRTNMLYYRTDVHYSGPMCAIQGQYALFQDRDAYSRTEMSHSRTERRRSTPRDRNF